MNAWDADVSFSLERIAALIQGQFPELAPARLEPLGTGWDNVAVRVNERFAFRFPRRKLGAELIERELRILPRLATHLPLPVPFPRFAGRPEGDYPYPFAGYLFVPGTTACRVAWTDVERARTARPLARFLAALHAVPIDDATRAWAPGDDFRKADLPHCWLGARDRLLKLSDVLQDLDLQPLLELGERLAPTPPRQEPPCWVHGDLYARHLLVGEDRRLAGVIDWGDVHLGDPALDLSIAFSFLPPSARSRFRTAYGEIDPATWDRARFRALFYGIVLTEYALAVSDADLLTAGRFALESVL